MCPCSFALEIYCDCGNLKVCQKHAVRKHYLVKTFYCIGMFQIAFKGFFPQFVQGHYFSVLGNGNARPPAFLTI